MSRALWGGVLCCATVLVGGCMRHRPTAVKPPVTGGAKVAVKSAGGCADSGLPPTRSSLMRLVPGKSTAEVRGIVVFAETGEPVNQASLWMDSTTGAPVVTAADGRFGFPAVGAGRHQLVMRRVGLRGIRDTIEAPVAGELRIEAAWLGMDPCGEFGSVYVGTPK